MKVFTPEEIMDAFNPEILDYKWVLGHFPQRDPSGHKGTFGKVLMIGGSLNMQGALFLACNGAMHSGAGTVTLFAPDQAAMILRTKLNSAMIHSASQKDGWFSDQAAFELKEIVNAYDMLCIGNGMGCTEASEKLVEAVLESDKPVVLDADAISLIGRHKERLHRFSPVILSPHPLELSRLLGKKDPSIKDLREFLEEYPNCTLIYKASFSLIANHQKACFLNHPNTSLAKGGSGDVLAGIVTGLLSWTKDPFLSACLAAWLHNQSAAEFQDNPAFMPEMIYENLIELFRRIRIDKYAN